MKITNKDFQELIAKEFGKEKYGTDVVRMLTDNGFELDLTQVVFNGMTLRNANFSGINFTGVDFTNSDFQKSNFSNANFTGADLEKAEFIRLHGIEAMIQMGVRYLLSVKNPANFGGTNIENANFTNANLKGASFFSGGKINANFTGADLTGTMLAYTDLNGSILVGANLERTDLTGSIVTKISLSDNNITESTKLYDTRVSRADLPYRNDWAVRALQRQESANRKYGTSNDGVGY